MDTNTTLIIGFLSIGFLMIALNLYDKYWNVKMKEQERRDREQREILDKIKELTPRQQQVLSMYGEGKSQKEIADELNRSVETVKKITKDMKVILNKHKNTELAVLAKQNNGGQQ